MIQLENGVVRRENKGRTKGVTQSLGELEAEGALQRMG